MTLIINAVTQSFVVHASDRLLTKRVGGVARVHSDVENKSLIIRAKDAIFVIGYTGAAYIGDVITDEWIASTITGMDLTEKFMLHQPGVRLRLNTALRRLEAGLKAIVLPGSSNYLAISVSGVRQRGRYVRGFIREFERNRGIVRSNGYMRQPRSNGFHMLSQLGDPVPYAILTQNIGKEFPGLGLSAEAFRQGMLNTIVERAKASRVVGDEVMTVTISRPPTGWEVIWTFESARPRHGFITAADGSVRSVFRSYFSPWIITPSAISKPSFGNSHLEHVAGDVTIKCGNREEASDDGGGLLMAVSSHERASRRGGGANRAAAGRAAS